MASAGALVSVVFVAVVALFRAFSLTVAARRRHARAVAARALALLDHDADQIRAAGDGLLVRVAEALARGQRFALGDDRLALAIGAIAVLPPCAARRRHPIAVFTAAATAPAVLRAFARAADALRHARAALAALAAVNAVNAVNAALAAVNAVWCGAAVAGHAACCGPGGGVLPAFSVLSAYVQRQRAAGAATEPQRQ